MTTTTQASAKLAVQEWEPYPELEKKRRICGNAPRKKT